MLIIETGTGLPNAESYASVAAADGYHAKRINTAWTSLDTPTKEALLIKATEYMVGHHQAGHRRAYHHDLLGRRAGAPALHGRRQHAGRVPVRLGHVGKAGARMSGYPVVKIDACAVHENTYSSDGKVWTVTNLISQAKDLVPFDLPLAAIYLGAEVWSPEGSVFGMAFHMRRALDVDTSYPVILCEKGFIMDG